MVMWHEIRKHEKKLRGIMVDYKKRSERRKEYYEKIKRDPAEFLQIWGRPCKIHFDQAVAAAGDNPSTMTPWRDDPNTIIDRFDVRAHLDIIDEMNLNISNAKEANELSEAERNEERMCNYERYRVLVQYEAAGVSEEQTLREIELDEKFGVREDVHPYVEKKKPNEKKAEIGFLYDDSAIPSTSKKQPQHSTMLAGDNDTDSEDEDDTFDLDLQIDVDQLTSDSKAIFNKCAMSYGMEFGDFVRMLILDKEELEIIRENKLIEQEKQQFSVKGRKARRERRLAKEKRLRERDFSPPSYMARELPKHNPYESTLRDQKSRSKSRSQSPVGPPVKEKIQFITAFGGSDDEQQKQRHQNGSPRASKRSSSTTTPKSKSSAIKINVKDDNKKRTSKPISKSLIEECLQVKQKLEPTPPPPPKPVLSTTPVVLPPVIIPHLAKKNDDLRERLSTLQKLKDTSPVLTLTDDLDDTLSTTTTKRNQFLPNLTSSPDLNRTTSPTIKIKNKSLYESNSYQLDTNDSKSDSDPSDDDDRNSDEQALKQYLKRKEARKKDGIDTKSKSSNEPNIKNESFNKPNEFKVHQEKLRRRMQTLLKKQFKKDKEVQREREEREEKERMAREAELRHLSTQLRKRDRDKRYRSSNRSDSDDNERSKSRTRSRSRSSSQSDKSRYNNHNESRAERTRTPSPPPFPITSRHDRSHPSSSSTSHNYSEIFANSPFFNRVVRSNPHSRVSSSTTKKENRSRTRSRSSSLSPSPTSQKQKFQRKRKHSSTTSSTDSKSPSPQRKTNKKKNRPKHRSSSSSRSATPPSSRHRIQEKNHNKKSLKLVDYE